MGYLIDFEEKTMLKEIAEKLHIKTNTIRYYEKEGLIKSDRLANKYRSLSEEQRIRLIIIVMLRIQGWRLKI